MNNKDRYRFTKVENIEEIKEVSEEVALYVGECIKKSIEFNKNKQEQLREIENSKRLLSSILDRIKKLDVDYLDKKAI